MARLNVFYYCDQVRGGDHSTGESLFNHYLRAHCDVTMVYYSRKLDASQRLDNGALAVSYGSRKRIVQSLANVVNLSKVDIVIVRNIFPVLRDVLRYRETFGYKVGFHYSFPHSFRRCYQARMTGRSRWRKELEYQVRRRLEARMIHRCDFILPISERLMAMLDLRRSLPCFPIHSGVDFSNMPAPAASERQADDVRFVYIGTVDLLRQVEVILAGFDQLAAENWRLDIYSGQADFIQALIRKTMRRHRQRVTIQPAMPRDQLYERVAGYDAGLNLIPPTELYNVSSPIKLMEYYALGLPTLMSRLPECEVLFSGQGCGWFADFDAEGVRQGLEAVLATPGEERRRMGAAGREIIRKVRNFERVAPELAIFLTALGV